MTPKNLLEEILKLPPQDRLQIIEQVWDSLAPADVPVSTAQKQELDRLLDQPSPGPDLSWDEVKARLREQK